MSNLILKNCKTVDDDIINIIVEDGIITNIKETLQKSDMTTDEVIDIKEKIVVPGLIDPHVHFRDPGATYKEDWESGSKAAAHGGYTSVIDMPNTIPQTDTLKAFQEKKEIALEKSYVDFGLNAGIKSKEDVDKIAHEVPAAYKIFMDLYTNEELDKMFSYIQGTETPLCLHCEDKRIVERFTELLKSMENSDQMPIMYSYARPTISEIISVNRAIELGHKYDLQIHICHVSSYLSLDAILSAPEDMVVTTEATPHHLLLDNSTYETYGVKAKTNPPLRETGTMIGTEDLPRIECIATDHAPHSIEEKQKDTWDTSPGIPNLETSLKLLLTQVNNNQIELGELIDKMTANPSMIFQIPFKGDLEVGYDGDFTIIDMKETGTISSDNFYSKAEYTPFENLEYEGSNIMTIKRGEVIADHDDVYKTDAEYIYPDIDEIEKRSEKIL